jgi:HD-like signal output (HDOD) protein
MDLDDAYLCGLLHDIGESRVYRILSESKLRPAADEVPVLVEKYHTRAGAELAMRWALPDELVQVCRRHEEPGPAESDRLRVVRLSDLLVERVLDPRGLTGALPREALAELDVSEHHARAILERGVREAARL